MLSLKKQSIESLKEFSAHYWRLYNDVEGSNEQIAVAIFKLGLPKESQLRQSLVKRSPSTQGELMERIEEFIKLEEDMAAPKPRWTRQMDEGPRRKRIKEFVKAFDRKMGRAEPIRATFEGTYTIFKDPNYRILTQIKDKPYFKRPLKMVSDPGRQNPNLWCSYHRDNNHLIENCRMLKQHLEDLVKEGHLKEYIESTSTKKN